MKVRHSSLRARLAALLDRAGLGRTSFREDLQRIVDEIVDGGEEERSAVRGAIRKGVPAEQWSALLRIVLDSLHPYDAIRVLSEAHVIRALEGVDETIFLNTGTRYSNMRIQAAAKEPWTYQWIRAAIRKGEVLYDIGANVGGYTLIALARGAQVVAFEPHHENYRELCRNVSLNRFESEATLIPVALSDRRGALRNPTFAAPAGQSMTLEVSDSGPVSIIADRLDDLRRDLSLPAPDHIKIDVDGFELNVLHGATETFAAPSLRTSLVEIDLRAQSPDQGRHETVCRFFAERGFATFDVTNPMAEGVNYLLALREQANGLKAMLEASGIGLRQTVA